MRREFEGFGWFNLSAPEVRVGGKYVRLWNLFNRRCLNGAHYWGFGLLQIGNRHLFYLGHSGVSLAFIGGTP